MLRGAGNLKIILMMCLISSLGRFALDSYLPSLPAIGSYFNIPDASVQLTLTVYLFGFSISQLIYGPLSDRYGRKNVISLGMIIFLVGSLGCVFAYSSFILLLSRLIAGMGAGACGVLNRAIASDVFKGAEFSKAWSYTTTTLVITLIVAPLLGGFIQDNFGWRANFILIIFFISAVFFAIFKYLPETRPAIFPLPSLKIQGVIKTYYKILISRSFVICTLCYTLAFSGLIIYFQVSPLLLMNVLGLTAMQYGWCSVVIAASYLIGGLLVNKLTYYLTIPQLLMSGASLLITGGLLMLLAYYFNYFNLLSILLPSAIYVLGARLIIPNAIAGSMNEFRHLGGSTSALIGCLQMLGSSFFSLIIANFDYTATPFPLAFSYIFLGLTSLIIIYFLKYQTSH